VPKIDADQVRAAVEPGGDKFFTVGSTDPEVRYRVRADAGGPAGLTVVATSLEDVDAAVSRLVAVDAADRGNCTGSITEIVGVSFPG
jgi:hypothetical protein